MKFIKLAKLFSDLEATTKRLEMIDILSDFFKIIKKNQEIDDLDKILYLLQGKLVSNIKEFPKMGLAEKMPIEALSIHSGVNKEKIKQILLKKGDIGAAAEIILSKQKKKQRSLLEYGKENASKHSSIQISELYSELKKIAKTEGSGSHDIKLGILRGLLRKFSQLFALLQCLAWLQEQHFK